MINIKNLNENELLLLSKALINNLGFEIEDIETSKKGIIIKTIKKEFLLNEKYVFLIKREDGLVKEEIIKVLIDEMYEINAIKGVIITNSSYTQNTKNYSGKIKIELLGEVEILELVKKLNIDIEKEICIDKIKLEDYEKRKKHINELADNIKKIESSITGERYVPQEIMMKKQLTIISLYTKMIFLSSDVKFKKETLDCIVNIIQKIEESEYMQKLNYSSCINDCNNKYILKKIKDQIALMQGDFCEIINDYMCITNKLDIENDDEIIRGVSNVGSILSYTKNHIKLKELISSISDYYESKNSQNEILLRGIRTEKDSVESKLMQINEIENVEFIRNMNKLHFENIKLIEYVLEKQQNDIDMLKSEVVKYGTIKRTNIFAKRMEDENINYLIKLLEDNINKFKKNKNTFEKMNILIDNKEVLEYKINLVREVLTSLFKINIETELYKKTMEDCLNSVMLKHWVLLNDIILSDDDKIFKIDFLNNSSVKRLTEGKSYIKEIKIIKKNILDHIQSLTSQESKYMDMSKQKFENLDQINKNVSDENIFIYLYNEKNNGLNYDTVNISNIIDMINDNKLELEIKKLDTLLSMYRFK